MTWKHKRCFSGKWKGLRSTPAWKFYPNNSFVSSLMKLEGREEPDYIVIRSYSPQRYWRLRLQAGISNRWTSQIPGRQKAVQPNKNKEQQFDENKSSIKLAKIIAPIDGLWMQAKVTAAGVEKKLSEKTYFLIEFNKTILFSINATVRFVSWEKQLVEVVD